MFTVGVVPIEHQSASSIYNSSPAWVNAFTRMPRLTRLQIDGLVGLDYLFQFHPICFYTASFQLVLEEP